jgi:hypothetical protein
MSYALQLLDVSCFKHFKTIFIKKKDGAMIRRKNNELNEVTLIGWVNKA